MRLPVFLLVVNHDVPRYLLKRNLSHLCQILNGNQAFFCIEKAFPVPPAVQAAREVSQFVTFQGNFKVFLCHFEVLFFKLQKLQVVFYTNSKMVRRSAFTSCSTC